MQTLKRRGFSLGPVPCSSTTGADEFDNWHQGKPVLLKQACLEMLETYDSCIKQSEALVLSILEGNSCEEFIDTPSYSKRLSGKFEPMGAAFNEGDEQEIEMVMFDAISNDLTTAEDLWMKVSWLSFHDEDASMRFRFSFGVDLEEDVAADPARQEASALLADAIFPESALITENAPLLEKITRASEISKPKFVERILYFNAPNGGAYLHHDLERGHAGVVYAQVSGSTFWLAIPLNELAREIQNFVRIHALPDSLSAKQQREITIMASDINAISKELNSFSNDALVHLINETQEFIQYLIEQGHGRTLGKGDAILLPQKDAQQCCWHSVFCIGEEVGQALSFAIR